MAMNYNERELRKLGDGDLAKIISGVHDAFQKRHPDMRDIALPVAAQAASKREPQLTPVEVLTFEPFTAEDREKLRVEGGVVYTLEGQSMRGQKDSGRRFWSTWHDGQEIELMTSRLIDIVIYPQDFFVSGTFGQSKPRQEELVRKSGQETQAKLGIEGYEEILPELPEATEVMFRHFDTTGVRLLGEDYRDPVNGYWRYIRTNTPTKPAGSDVADVGHFVADYGPGVRGWYVHGSNGSLSAARWGVKVRGIG